MNYAEFDFYSSANVGALLVPEIQQSSLLLGTMPQTVTLMWSGKLEIGAGFGGGGGGGGGGRLA